MLQLVGNLGGVGVLGMVVAIATVAVAGAYAIRPTEPRLALMRPLSLATIFAALFSFTAGLAMILNGISATAGPIGWSRVAAGAAESLAPLFGAFGCLTIAWILVAIGFRRH
jgi:hypothetical protein